MIFTEVRQMVYQLEEKNQVKAKNKSAHEPLKLIIVAFCRRAN
jgi:hypothetical protein